MMVTKQKAFFLLALGFVAVHVFIFALLGIRNLFDANGYISSADFLFANGALIDSSHVFYIVPIGLITIFRALFPGEIIPFLCFQTALSALATMYLYRASALLFRSTLSGVITATLFIVWLDVIHWNTVAMTESIFCSLVCFVLYRLVMFEGRRGDWIVIFVLMVLLFFTRPTSIVVMLGLIVFFLRQYSSLLSSKPIVKVFVGVFLLAIILVGAYMMFSLWDFTDQYRRGNVITYADVVEGTELSNKGMRVDTVGVQFQESTAHPLIKMADFIFQNPIHFAKAGMLKLWYLLSATRPYYSSMHNVYALCWMLLLYTLAFMGIKRGVSFSLVYAVMGIVVFNCMLIAIGTVDWDNRFYIPMAPGIVLFAGGGGALIMEKLKKVGNI
ncbi:hypothetical protein [Pseudochryseolinea flava]|uniref:Glycosyltransferase RgtA/B/C/D-like domain-containing protein n=1 Tax=Pseudochryseolinea flava TaxID=2059302 RepID=A0A364Y7D6_9BACT|nr:hypothetical protein [Pseudochryseolinea flava]RAW02307.1 hypothetical protein DQQ10_07170 [Pseudochryseolinea flava]